MQFLALIADWAVVMAPGQREENQTNLSQNSPCGSSIMTSEQDESGCKSKPNPSTLNIIYMPPSDTENAEVRLETS